LEDLWRSDRLVRLAPMAAVVSSASLSVIQAALAFSYVGNGIGTGLWTIAATAVYLPLHLRHVWYAARAHRPPLGGWSLAAMTVVIVGAAPLAGNMWPRAYTALVVSFLLILPAPWSYLGYVVMVTAAAPVAHALGLPWSAAPWLTFSVLSGSAALLLLVWLAAALTRLQIAREELAQRAVMQERRRIDDELRQSVGGALESIAARGDRAATRLAHAEPGEAAKELIAIADAARRTLADARRRIHGYRQPSLRTELETAASLLNAAGIATRLDLPRTGIPDVIVPQSRDALRAAVTRLLRARPTAACTITGTIRNGRVLLEVRADATETIEVPA
jgi:two-component system sensor histidine kinase DesK